MIGFAFLASFLIDQSRHEGSVRFVIDRVELNPELSSDVSERDQISAHMHRKLRNCAFSVTIRFDFGLLL